MKYQIITGESPYKLERLVGESIAKGWVPSGGVSTVTLKSNDGIMFIQAMILNGK